jgi:hypothetical protein
MGVLLIRYLESELYAAIVALSIIHFGGGLNLVSTVVRTHLHRSARLDSVILMHNPQAGLKARFGFAKRISTPRRLAIRLAV